MYNNIMQCSMVRGEMNKCLPGESRWQFDCLPHSIAIHDIVFDVYLIIMRSWYNFFEQI